MLSGKEVLPVVEGGKGIAVSNGESSGAWASAGGIGTFSGVNADSYDAQGKIIPQIYHGKTRRERHEELIAYAVKGGITQAKIAYERSNGQGRIHMNVLWEMGGSERVLHGVLEGAKGLINGITCGAGMPYRLAELCAQFGVYYYPIVSSAVLSTRCGSALITNSRNGWALSFTKIHGAPVDITVCPTVKIR
jgi:hypothetical protein